MREKALIVALDVNRAQDALALAKQLSPKYCRMKVGKELFTREGRALVEALHALGHEIFLDLKFHDIPHTVAAAVRVAAEMGVWMVNVHASGGRKMLVAAADAVGAYSKPPLLIAVTVLTSLNDADLHEIGVNETVSSQVSRLTGLAATCGLDGVVCSAHEAATVKAVYGLDFMTVTPGIRPIGTEDNDQARVMTPQQAIMNGSDYLVIGRPITQDKRPAAALEKIVASMQEV
ncbi:MAG: orotidine-5'-phosphate decarboxylase [Cardiobacteriaceae bacterium]|nr:orotidine-5'-phosphate decarboxylase [Cardiobacteriaceae bacterium]